MASKNVVCVDSLANCDSVPPLHRAMRLRKDLLVVVLETFSRMFNHNHDSLVSQALNCGLIKDLLSILGSSLANIPNASACKAQVHGHNLPFLPINDLLSSLTMTLTPLL